MSKLKLYRYEDEYDIATEVILMVDEQHAKYHETLNIIADFYCWNLDNKNGITDTLGSIAKSILDYAISHNTESERHIRADLKGQEGLCDLDGSTGIYLYRIIIPAPNLLFTETTDYNGERPQDWRD